MNINFKSVRAAYLRLRAIAHPLRLQLIDFIDKKNEINVNVIYHTLKLEQSVTSQHLKILRDAVLVKTRRDGKKIFYAVHEKNVKRLVDLAEEIESIK